MPQSNHQPENSNLLRGIAVAILGAWFASLALTCWDRGILLPFAWPEVGAVHVACAIPLAWLLWQAIGAKIAGEGHSLGMTLVLSAAMLGVFRLLFWHLSPSDTPPELLANSHLLLRVAAGFTAAMGIAGLLLVLNSRWFISHETERQPIHPLAWTFAAMTIALVPTTYEYSRVKSDATTAHEHLSQSRLAEAADLLNRCVVLDSTGSFHGEAFCETLPALTVEIDRIRQYLQQPLSEPASEQQLIERGKALAMLGRNEEALLVLLPAASSPQFGQWGGHQLLGTLYQDRRDWEESLFHFRLAAHDATEKNPIPLANAMQGQAFALRKLGRIEDAEAAYLELLGLAPTADNHFLLAQFYDDIQDTHLAVEHAELAKKLDPTNYQGASDSLVRQATANHFGCFPLLGQ